MAIRRATISAVSATGGAGTATATGYSDRPITGYIIAVHVSYQDSPPATTDVTIAEAVASPAVSVLTLSNANTSGWFFPRAAGVNQSGTAITNSNEKIAVSDMLSVVIAQANDGDGAVVTVIYDEVIR